MFRIPSYDRDFADENTIISSLGKWKLLKGVKIQGHLTPSIHSTMYLKHWETYPRLKFTLWTRGQWLPTTLLHHLRPQRRRRIDQIRVHLHHRSPDIYRICHRKLRTLRKNRVLQWSLQLESMETPSLRRRPVLVPRPSWQIMNWRSRTREAV